MKSGPYILVFRKVPRFHGWLLLCAAISLGGHNASAQPANEPLGNFIVTDGIVYAMAKQGNTLYVGGKFTQAGISTGGGVVVSTTTGLPVPSAPSVNGTVNHAIPDGNGGWFVGGLFTLAGGSLHSNLFHLRGNLTVDPGWSPRTSGAVSALALSGGKLYLGGTFTNVNGQLRNRLAALDPTTGALSNWDPNANDAVSVLLADGTNLYCGGSFTTIGGLSRSHVASISTLSGAPAAWNPGADDLVQAMTSLSGHLYIGGYFGTVMGQPRARLASFDMGSGSLDPWSPGIAGVTVGAPLVYALATYQTNILVGGMFTSLGGSNRVNIGSVDSVAGGATSWDAAQVIITSSGFAGNYVQALLVQSNVVYVGGPLGNIAGQPRFYAAALDADTASALSWDPGPT